jgi:hypothetical protein
MRKSANIESYMRRLLVILYMTLHCCNHSLMDFLIYAEIFVFFFISAASHMKVFTEYTECVAFCPVVRIGSSHPLTRKRVAPPPPLGPRWETRKGWRWWGPGVTKSDKGTGTLYSMCTTYNPCTKVSIKILRTPLARIEHFPLS